MTNSVFNGIEDYRDVEVHNAWRQWVTSGRVAGGDMLRYFAKVARDNARTPMQWSAAPNGGFTEGKPWLAVNPNYTEINAADQQADPNSVFHYYRRLIALRHEHPIIVYGRFVPLMEDDPHIYAYRRELDGRRLTVVCNFAREETPCGLFESGAGRELISNYSEHKPGALLPFEARAVLE